METIFLSKEFIAAAFGSLVGGIFVLVGSYLSLRWKNEQETTHRAHLITLLVRDVIDNINYYTKELDTKYATDKIIWFQHIDGIRDSISQLSRNGEHLIFIEENTLRTNIRRKISDASLYVNSLNGAQQRVYEIDKIIGQSDKPQDDPDIQKLRIEYNRIRESDIPNWISELRNVRADLIELRGRLG
jgi:hypothetical protein